jgi:hypothetical protein
VGGTLTAPAALQAPTAATSGGSGFTPFDRVVEVALVLLFAAEALDELRGLRRRVRRGMSLWWAGVERRERHRLHLAEVDYLSRRVGSHARHRRQLTRVG